MALFKLIFLIFIFSSKPIEKNFINLFHCDKLTLEIESSLGEDQENQTEDEDALCFFYFQIEDKLFIPKSFSKLKIGEPISVDKRTILSQQMTIILKSIEESIHINKESIKEEYFHHFTSAFDESKLSNCYKQTESSFYCIYRKKFEK